MPEQLYVVKVEGGGKFLYDPTDVGRFVKLMAGAGDGRTITIEPADERDLRPMYDGPIHFRMP